MELVVRDRTYIIRQVSSPDMKALRGGITEEFTTTEDLAVQQLQDFHYWASGTIVSARGDREEYETRLELLRQQGMLCLLLSSLALLFILRCRQFSPSPPTQERVSAAHCQA